MKYLLPEDPNIVNRALGEQLAAKRIPNHVVAARELTAAQILTPAQLTAEELTFYKTLTDPAKAKNFILTRSYMRLAQKVADHKKPALQLPDPLVGFSPDYLLPGEAAVKDKAVSALLAVEMKQNIR